MFRLVVEIVLQIELQEPQGGYLSGREAGQKFCSYIARPVGLCIGSHGLDLRGIHRDMGLVLNSNQFEVVDEKTAGITR